MRPPAIALVLVALAWSGGAGADGQPAASDAVWKGLESATLDLARKNRAEEVEDLLDVLVRLGRPAEDAAKVRDAARRALSKAGKRAPAAPESLKSVKKAAVDLLPLLASAAGENRLRLAEAIALLDSSTAAAEEALGRVLIGGRFVPRDTSAILKRRAELAEALRKSRRLEVPIEQGVSDLPLFENLYGKKGVYVKWDKFSLHSVRISIEKLERMLRESVRATAFSNYVRTGTLALPVPVAAIQTAALGSQEDYLRAIDEAMSHGGMEAKDRDWYRTTGSFEDKRGHIAAAASVEAYEEATYVYWLFRRQSRALFDAHGQPCLNAGHLNWVCLSCLGTTSPLVAYVEVKETRAVESDTVGRAKAVEREEMRRLAEAGIAGTHAWMAWQAARREDAPWTSAMLDDIGKIGGEARLKATVVTEYLQETGEFQGLWMATLPEKAEKAMPIAQVMAKGLGQELPIFEARWREWLLPPRDGVAQKLEAPPPTPLDPAIRRLLDHLDSIRRASLGARAAKQFLPLGVEASLSKGCTLHAEYLAKHPDQAAKWPDAHEEYPDREGFTPEGGFAGLHSVIAPGADGPEDAVDRWMGTFFHRLPLLDPGLRRVGWGYEKKIAVLDSGSMVALPDAVLELAWPPDGAKDVPTRFVPEIPNPVPGEDQGKWGYPVTLQLFQHVPEPLLTLHLYQGTPSPSRGVSCHVTSADKPANVELAPRATWCLIPKAPLSPRTQYSVVAEGFPDGKSLTWTFFTAAR